MSTRFQPVETTEPKEFSTFITPEEAATALSNWVTAMQAGNPKAVARLYDRAPSLWGTIAETLATTYENVLAYFELFLRGKNNLQITIETRHPQSVGPVCFISGSYSFRFTDNNGKEQTIPARYSFGFLKKENGDVVITNHHSSRTPCPEDHSK